MVTGDQLTKKTEQAKHLSKSINNCYIWNIMNNASKNTTREISKEVYISIGFKDQLSF